MSYSKHENALNRIMKCPGLVIPDKLYWTAKETNFYRDGQNIHCQPDFMAYSKKGSLYILEYKCTDNAANERKAKHQLKRAKRFVQDMGFNGDIRTLYIGGGI